MTVKMLKIMLIISLCWYAGSRMVHKLYPVRTYSADGPAIPATQQNFKSLKIGSYNIAHGRGGATGASNWQKGGKEAMYYHLDQIARQIREADVDVVVLNEIDFVATWSHNINQAQYLMEKSGFRYRVEQSNMLVSMPFLDYHFGNAVLSKYPLEGAFFVDLPSLSQREDFFAGNQDGFFCKVVTPAGSLGLMVVHLEYRSEDVRVKSAKMINMLSEQFDVPVIAAGDFNSSPLSTPRSTKNKEGENAMDCILGPGQFTSYVPAPLTPQKYTFPSASPDRIIDWIVGKGIKRFRNSTTIVSSLSDHFMITSDVDF